MADAVVLTDIRNMIDLAIGSPEVGVVDFCMLHSVLHCLAQQLHVLHKPVELRGSAATVPTAASAAKDKSMTVAIMEYVVETDGATSEKPANLKPEPTISEPPTLLVVERVRRDSPIDVMPAGKVTDHRTGTAKSQASSGRGGREGDKGTGGQKTGGRRESGQGAGSQRDDGQEADSQRDRDQGSLESVRKESDTRASEPRAMSSTEKLSLVTWSKFNLLGDVVQDLKDRVYGSIPKNEQILEEVRSQTNLKSITDMWTNLNVSSRLEAAEAGLGKLSSLVEDLIREAGQRPAISAQAPTAAAPSAPVPAAPTPPPAPATEAAGATAAAGTTGATGAAGATGTTGAAGATGTTGAAEATGATGATAAAAAQAQAVQPQWQPPPQVLEAANVIAQLGPPFPWDTMASELYEERVSVLQQLQRLRNDLDILNKAFYDVVKNMQDGLDPKQAASVVNMEAAVAMSAPPPLPPPPLPPVPTPAVMPQLQVPEYAQPQQYAPVAPGNERSERRSSGSNAAMMERLAQLEKRIKECCDSKGKDKGTVQDQLNNFQDQLDKLMRQVAGVHDDTLKISPNLAKDLEGLMQLYKTVQDMQEQLRQVNETARLLAGEKDDRQHHMNALLEQIEILKTIKMDREDMVEAMAEKADLRLLARKVSHDQFEMACDDLSRGLEHALGKLNTQESLWQQVLDDIQREIETKLDKMELSPLKEFFNNKLRMLQDNLKQMASLRRDVEAAGTSRRLLRDVNCISCDAKAVMQMENTNAATSKPLPAHLSMKPYLSYELDSIRKTQASNLPQRNLHDWETIDKQMAPKPPVKVRSDTDKHICNRYCGGSHTTTTPAQRVARLGHFIKQWGPDVVPLSSGFAAGDDGRLYKVSTAEHAAVSSGGPVAPTCTKKPKAPEPSKPAPKSLSPSPECRCLDGN